MKAPLIASILLLPASIGLAGDINLPPLDTPYDQYTFLATHNSYANPDHNFTGVLANQPNSITDQLNYGVRVINLDTWLIRQKKNLVDCWIWEVYPDADTTPGSGFSTSDPLQVVVGHSLDHPIFADSTRADVCGPWTTLTADLNVISDWVEQHPDQVVTIEFEPKTATSLQDIVDAAIAASRASTHNHLFRPAIENPDFPAPNGRAGGWNVDRYGYPTLRQLVENGRTIVLFPTLPRAAPGNPYVPGTADSWKLEVQTVYGAACLEPNDAGMKWVQPRDESTSINDFTRLLFSLVHVPDFPTTNCYALPGCINDIARLRHKWDDVKTRYNRLPNFVWVDYYDRGFNGAIVSSDPPGPALFVNELNAMRAALPQLSTLSVVSPAANVFGWNNTDVQVSLVAFGGNVQAITSKKWTDLHLPSPFASSDTTYQITNEGNTTVSYSAVGDLGSRSEWKQVDVHIDKTPPTITGKPSRPPDKGGWYGSNVTVRFECSDALSGVASCPSDVVLTNEGANQSVTGTSEDRAGNRSTTNITNINIDLNGPMIRATASSTILWPPNGKFVPVVISGTMTDTASGVDPATTCFTVQDEYKRVQPKGHVVVGKNGNYCFTVLLESSRLGQDKDGRHYTVQLDAKDIVGHASKSTVAILVPHDQR